MKKYRNRSAYNVQNTHLSGRNSRSARAVTKSMHRDQPDDIQAALFKVTGLVLLALGLVLMNVHLARATEIQRVVSPGGIEAWLVEDDTVPIIAMDFSFSGGSTQDETGKAGGVSMLTSLLDEGAGDLTSQDFQTKLEENAIRLSFDAGRDRFYGSLRTLSPNRDLAFELVGLALQKPRFDEEPIERMRAQWTSSARRAQTDPNAILAKTFAEAAYPDHPYSMPRKGTVESLKAINQDDIKRLHRAIVTRDDLTIGVVGAIDAKSLAPLLDQVFGPLPEKGELKSINSVSVAAKGLVRKAFTAPQTAIRFGAPGIERHDKDFYAAYIVNHILGGGSFSSRLYSEIREKRGLAYGVYSYLINLDHMNQFGGGMSTRTENANQAVALVKSEIARMGKEGPSEKELEAAKKYLTGSYALRFDTSSKIARQLVGIQDQDLGIDYFDKRNGYIEAVTIEDAKQAAKRLLNNGDLLIVTVGELKETAKSDKTQ